MTASSLPHPGDRRLPLAFVLGLVAAIGPLTTDLYLPSLPLIAGELAATEWATQLTLSGMVLGLAIGQFLAGSLSDAWGRRSVLLASIALHVCTAFACAIAPTIETLIAARVLMGMASAGGAVVAIAIVRDGGAGDAMLRTLAALAVVSGVAPLVAPIIGSQLLWIIDWRGIFLVLAGYSIVASVVVALAVPETLGAAGRTRMSLSAYRAGAAVLWRDRVFVGLVVVSAMSWSVLFTHLASSPFIMTHVFGLGSTQYGLVFVAFSVAFVAGTQTGARVARRIGISRMISWGVGVQILGGVGLLSVSALRGTPGLVATTTSLAVAVVGVAMCIPTVQTLALARHGDRAGLAASMLGGVSLTVAGLCTTVAGAWGTVGISALAVAIVCLAVSGAVANWSLVGRPQPPEAVRESAVE